MNVRLPAAPEREAFQIMPANWPSFTAFLACSTQWRVVASMAGLGWLGLDYVACKLVLDDMNAPPGAFADLHVMEKAALPILNGVNR
ncbi:DUF1799 domain-containing protein [Ensifer aridi]|uniref:DUF1799 domain-containing protein n=1 Tax=Ensifer aridi TaxID=1708715 RepID=UPI000A105A20|nr:DUF1799 domain-containing protein [Ensifer aridi]